MENGTGSVKKKGYVSYEAMQAVWKQMPAIMKKYYQEAYERGFAAGMQAGPHAWISADAMLPEPGERVLATDGVLVGEAYRTSADSWYRAYDAAWRKFGSKVTHWMPMPEAPDRPSERQEKER